jgi:hypothetical protein
MWFSNRKRRSMAAIDDFYKNLSSTPQAGSVPAPAAPTSLLQRFGTGVAGRIAMSIAVSLAGAAIMNSPKIFKAITYLCALIASLGGDDAKKLGARAADIIHQGADAADAPPSEKPKPSIIKQITTTARDKVEVISGKAGEKIEDAKEKGKVAAAQVNDSVQDVKKTVTTVGGDIAKAVQQPQSTSLPVAGQPNLAGMTIPQNLQPPAAPQPSQPNAYAAATVPGAGNVNFPIPANIQAQRLPGQRPGRKAPPGNLPPGLVPPAGMTTDALPSAAMPKSPYNAACPLPGCGIFMHLAPSQHKSRACNACGRSFMPAAARAKFAMLMMARQRGR